MRYSIIVAVYNIKFDYLKRCIASVMEQEKCYELLIINDGSTREETLRYLSKLDKLENSYIKIFDTINQGVSVARNIGIEHAKGDYCLFLDGDDFLDEECLSRLNTIVLNQDIVFFKNNFYCDKTDKLIKNDDDFTYKKIINKNVIISEIINPQNISENVNYGTPWAKVISKDLIDNHNLRFETNLPRTQDRVFLYDCVNSSTNIGLFNYSGYIYNSNEESVCKKYNKDLALKLNAVHECMKLRTNNTFYEKDVEMMYINFFYEILALDTFHKDKDINVIDRFIEANKLYNVEFKKQIMHVNNHSELSKKRKIMCYLFRFHLKYVVFIMYFIRNNK